MRKKKENQELRNLRKDGHLANVGNVIENNTSNILIPRTQQIFR